MGLERTRRLLVAGILVSCARSGLDLENEISSGGGGTSANVGGVTGASGAPACSDGALDPGEICDDGNRVSGDGCSSRCRAEPVFVTLGWGHACALSSTGVVKCWGANDFGQLGIGDQEARGDEPGEMGSSLPAVDLGTGRRATALACGYEHCCAVLDDGGLKCWGNGSSGALGQGAGISIGLSPGQMGDALPVIDVGTGRRVVAVGAGAQRTCALLDDESVKCWGYNGGGALGLGLRDGTNRGDRPGQMGDALPRLDFGPGVGVKAIASGIVHNCALLDDGRWKCWGKNYDGELGIGDNRDRGDAPGEMGDALQAPDFLPDSGPYALSVGWLNTCGLFPDDSVRCWGANATGNLGLGDQENRGDEPGEMNRNLPPVDLGTNAIAEVVAPNHMHSCALLRDGRVKCWGGNAWGALGIGDTRDRGDDPGEMGDQLPAVDLGSGRRARTISTSFGRTCALLDDGTIKCWGSNFGGVMGLGDVEHRGDQPGEMGAALPVVDLGF